MLTLRNREHFAENARLAPLVEQIALCISQGSPVHALEEQGLDSRPDSGWIVFADSRGCGIGVHLSEYVPNFTLLRRRINHVVFAQRLAGCFGGRSERFSLSLVDAEECPADWRIYRARFKGDSFLCAASVPAPELTFEGIHRARYEPRVTARLVGLIPCKGDLYSGMSLIVPKVLFEIPGQKISGNISSSEEGTMTLTPTPIHNDDEGREAKEALVRLELGDLRLTLEELAGLRNGSRLELEGSLPMQCFLVAGSTTLAIGELCQDEAGLMITITEVIS